MLIPRNKSEFIANFYYRRLTERVLITALYSKLTLSYYAILFVLGKSTINSRPLSPSFSLYTSYNFEIAPFPGKTTR